MSIPLATDLTHVHNSPPWTQPIGYALLANATATTRLNFVSPFPSVTLKKYHRATRMPQSAYHGATLFTLCLNGTLTPCDPSTLADSSTPIPLPAIDAADIADPLLSLVPFQARTSDTLTREDVALLVWLCLVSHPDLSSNLLTRFYALIRHWDSTEPFSALTGGRLHLLYALLRHPHTPLLLITPHCNPKDHDSSLALAANPSTPPALLQQLLSHRCHRCGLFNGQVNAFPIQVVLAHNPQLPLTLLKRLARHRDPKVRAAVVQHPAATPELILRASLT